NPSPENLSHHPLLVQQTKQLEVAASNITLIRKENNPEISVRAFSQQLYGIPNPVSGFSFNLEVPILGRANKSKVEAAQVEKTLQENLFQMETQQLQISSAQALDLVKKAEEALNYYESTGLPYAKEIIKAANQAYRAGEISFADLSQFLTQAVNLRKNHLDALNEYNQAVIRYEYFVSQ
ncbi:MAG TPA: TolC family protein, partial [Saprospiraceae bacterium]|nr:TolC family protein [Saprospiraceae bacterium]